MGKISKVLNESINEKVDVDNEIAGAGKYFTFHLWDALSEIEKLIDKKNILNPEQKKALTLGASLLRSFSGLISEDSTSKTDFKESLNDCLMAFDKINNN